MIDVERLKHDPDYWDSPEVDAPKDATHYIFSNKAESGIKPGFYREKTDMYVVCGGAAYWWKGSDITVIPRPTRKQWSGPEDGLPPVGLGCEYYDCENGWVLTHILSHHPNGDCAWHQSVRADGFVDGRSFSTDGAHSFRPLKSEKERVVEAAMKIGGLRARDGAKEVYGALYDSGFLKMPKEDQ